MAAACIVDSRLYRHIEVCDAGASFYEVKERGTTDTRGPHESVFDSWGGDTGCLLEASDAEFE